MRDISRGLGDKTLEGQMTRLRQIAMASLAALAIGGAASSANAMQTGTFQNRLNGATIGLPLGAAPPPGLYSGIETAYLGLAGQNGGRGNQLPGQAVPAVAQAVPFLYVPGWNFFGATYSFGVVQAFYMGSFSSSLGNLNTPPVGSPLAIPVGGFGWYEVLANTFWSPINFSWNLGQGWFFSASFNVTGPDGSRWAGTPNPDYWTFEPAAAISYLGNNMVASANFFYDINTQSTGPCCVAASKPVTSGNSLYIDGYWTWKIGKWQLGPVAYTEIQTTSDTGPGCAVAGGALCGNLRTVDVGALVGYDFGPVDMQVWFTQSVYRQNAIDGFDMWTRIGFKLWGPEAPKPLVAKN
jgi:hypothetical protein